MNLQPETNRKATRAVPRYIKEETDGERAPGAVLNAALLALGIVLTLAIIGLSFPGARTAIGLPEPPAQEMVPALMRTGIRVTEAMTSNQSAFPDENGAFPDWIEITNTGDTAENIKGFTLSDKPSSARFTFPDRTLEPGEIVIVFASGTSRADAEPFHSPMKLSASGETIYFNNAQNERIETIELPALDADMSFARGSAGWSREQSPTPGFPNTKEGREAFVALMDSSNASVGSLRLNEIMAANGQTLYDADGDASDWIELYNGGGTAIDLSGYALSDDTTSIVKWRFPQGAVIQPYSTYIAFASGKAAVIGDFPHTNFKLASNHGVVILSDLGGRVVDSTEYDNLKTDVSWARRGDADLWETTSAPTPGSLNQ
ncbi:MAG: lamin tail domain-containing protein [Oscillospiraceae bacterium]|nr:lamin tail domain-containing protein [Oscillospiraceae bacterium]